MLGLAALAGAGILAVAVEQPGPALGQYLVDGIVARLCSFDKEWRGERRDHRHGHDDGIDALVQHTEPCTQGGDDERELTDLG